MGLVNTYGKWKKKKKKAILIFFVKEIKDFRPNLQLMINQVEKFYFRWGTGPLNFLLVGIGDLEKGLRRLLMLVKNTKRCFSMTKSYKQAVHSENTPRVDHFPSPHLTAWMQPMVGTENGAGPGCFSPIPLCLRWGFVASGIEFCQHTICLLPRRELKVKATFIIYVYSALSLGHLGYRGLCSLARGCQGRWFLSHWHPLVEENTGRILLLRHKIRDVVFARRGISFQTSAMLSLVRPLKCQATACACPIYLHVVLGCVLGEIRMLTSSINQTKSNISSEYAKALLVMMAISAQSFRVRTDTCLKEVFCKAWCSGKLHQLPALAAGFWRRRFPSWRTACHIPSPLAALHLSSSLTPRRELCWDLGAGLHVSILSLLWGEIPPMVLSFEEHVEGNQDLGAGTGHGTCPGQVLKLLYEHPTRLDDKLFSELGVNWRLTVEGTEEIFSQAHHQLKPKWQLR